MNYLFISKIYLAFCILLCFLFFSCSVDRQILGRPYDRVRIADEFSKALNKYYDGSVQYLVAKSTANGKYSTYVVLYDHLTHSFTAYNLTPYRDFIFSPEYNVKYYLAHCKPEDIVTDLEYRGADFYSPSLNILFEEDPIATKDLEKIGAFKEKLEMEQVGQRIASDFGLSEERGIMMAKLANQWREISKI
ncbi:MAG: hypothetical protein HQK51_16020 [Oligoflexia bacterium]|nr:hypothetical protein [Oligoflexia bacterium]